MIDVRMVEEIIATYEKYGWQLRRVLLSDELKKQLGDSRSNLFENTSVINSLVDAAWFSRPPNEGGVAWELRYLGDIPFALLEKVDENDSEFENILNGVEVRLREAIAKKQMS
jgi:hypothetical protein